MGVNVKINYYLNAMILLFAVCTDQVFAGPQNWNEGNHMLLSNNVNFVI